MKVARQLGALVGFKSGGGKVGLRPAYRTAERVSLWLVPPRDFVSRMVDRSTGGLGFGHMVIHMHEMTADGVALVVDCQPGQGALRVAASFYLHRQPRQIALNADQSRWAYDAVTVRLGQPYDLRGDDGVSCATMAYRALPPELRAWVDRTEPRGVAGRIISPNRIAEAFK